MQSNFLLRLPDVVQRRGISRASVYKEAANGLFTRPIRTHGRLVAWPQSEVDALIRARIEGRGEREIRELVRQLHAARTASRQLEAA